MMHQLSKNSVRIDIILLAACIAAGIYYKHEFAQVCLFLAIGFRPFVDLMETFIGKKPIYKLILLITICFSFPVSMYVLYYHDYISSINLFVITLLALHKLYISYDDKLLMKE